MKIRLLIFVVMLFALESIDSQENDLSAIFKSGVDLVKLSGEFSFTEGPTADKAGNVYFTDQPNDRIMIWSTKGELSTFMQPSGRSNGMFFDNHGTLWSCADEKSEIWIIEPGKKPEVIALEYEGRRMNGPNDLWVSPEGNIFLTDSFYKRPWWKHSEMTQEKQCVYFLSSDRKIFKRVEEELLQPNGIVGTPDGKRLYVADIKANLTWSYNINADGSLGDKKLFCELGSDGMTIDSKGNIYLTGRGVTVFDKNGKKLGNITVPESWSGNVCFGGKNRKTLFITASKGLYSIRTRIRGAY